MEERGFFSDIFNRHHHRRNEEGEEPEDSEPAAPPAVGEIVKVYCAARSDYNLTIRDGEVVLVPGDDSDPIQSWIKDESWSTRVKDEANFPAFALVNLKTGQALRHADGLEAPVLLEPYEQNVLKETTLWTASNEVGDEGYYAIRPVSDIRLNLDADHGSEKYGGVKDGNKVILFTWKDERNQYWKIERLGHTRNL